MDKITTTFIRILKELNIYNILPKNDDTIKSLIKCINYNTFFNYLSRFYGDALYGIDSQFKMFFKLSKYNSFFRKYKTICIIGIKDYNRFGKFLNDNGIVWNTYQLFTDYDIKKFEEKSKRTNVYFSLDFNNLFNLRHGSYETLEYIYMADNRLILKEEEFYEYYLNVRNEVIKRLNWWVYDNNNNNQKFKYF